MRGGRTLIVNVVLMLAVLMAPFAQLHAVAPAKVVDVPCIGHDAMPLADAGHSPAHHGSHDTRCTHGGTQLAAAADAPCDHALDCGGDCASCAMCAVGLPVTARAALLPQASRHVYQTQNFSSVELSTHLRPPQRS